MILKIIKWIWRGWPIVILVVLAFIHFSLVYAFCLNSSEVNKAVSLVSQILGGLLILYSIDSNIGIIRNINLKEMFSRYLSEFPMIKKSVVSSIDTAYMIMKGGEIKLSVNRSPKNIDEKLQYLQEQIDNMKREFEDEIREIRDKENKENEEFRLQLTETKLSLSNIEKQMDEVSLGGVKIQIFGIFLMIYGGVAGYFS